MRSSMYMVAASWAILASGCTSLPDWALFGPLADSESSASGSYSFSWRLSGDRGAGPLQVFDDGRNTWLQFLPEQPLPAIFARDEQGDKLLHYRRQGPYVVLEGVWPQLVLRAGALESRVEQVAPQDLIHDSGASGSAAVAAEPAAVDEGLDALPILPSVPLEAESLTASSVETPAPQPAESSPSLGPLSQSALTPLAMAPEFRVSPQDGNIRLALGRWSRASGWTFQAEHWAVDVDIPIVGSAVFQHGFVQAVQQLLASTELSDRPLQPCFYANKVLRVVSYAQNCDRTAPPEQI